MWIPKQLTIRNVLTHANTVIDFNNGATTVVVGNNLSEPDQGGNGSGKSAAMIDATSFALTGELIRKDTVFSDLISNWADDASVEFSLENSRTEEFMVIRREAFRSKSKSSTLTVTIDGEVVIHSPKTGNKKLLEIIGISKQDIYDYYIVFKEKYNSFYHSTDAEKKDLIARFSKANRIDPVFGIIKEMVGEKEASIAVEKNKILKLEGSISVYQSQLENTSIEELREADRTVISNKMADIDGEVKGLKDKIMSNKAQMAKDKKEAKDIEKQIADVKADMEAIKLEDLSGKLDEIAEAIEENEVAIRGYENEMREVRQGKRNNQSSIDAVEKDIASINKKLANELVCPKCDHRWAEGTDESIEELEAMIAKKKKTIKQFIEANEKIDEDLVAIKEDIQQCERNIDEWSEYRKEVTHDNNEKEKDKKKKQAKIDELNLWLSRSISSADDQAEYVNRYNRRISTLNEEKAGLEDELVAVDTKDYGDALAGIKKNIEKLEKEKQDLESSIETVTAEAIGINKWITRFKRFYTYLSNKSLKTIENNTNAYLGRMGSSLGIKVDGFKVLESGDIRETIHVSVKRNGVNNGSFSKHSEGEKARMNLSTILSNQDLINRSASSGGLGMLICDEILESISPSGIQSIVEALDRFHRTVYLITQFDVDTVKNNSNSLIFEKGIDGITKIV